MGMVLLKVCTLYSKLVSHCFLLITPSYCPLSFSQRDFMNNMQLHDTFEKQAFIHFLTNKTVMKLPKHSLYKV